MVCHRRAFCGATFLNALWQNRASQRFASGKLTPVLRCAMPRWLFETTCVIAFAAPIGAACLHVWPFVMGRPLPIALDTETALLIAIALLLSAGMTMLMSASIHSARGRR